MRESMLQRLSLDIQKGRFKRDGRKRKNNEELVGSGPERYKFYVLTIAVFMCNKGERTDVIHGGRVKAL